VPSRTRPGSPELATLSSVALTDVTFVQIAGGARIDGHRLSLLDLAPTTIWLLSGLRQRIGHMATGTFLDLWWDSDSGLREAALMAELGQADPDATFVGDSLFRVRAPRIRGAGIQFDLEILCGSLPGRCGACVLFMGPGQHPR
jgi:hypothetical protein